MKGKEKKRKEKKIGDHIRAFNNNPAVFSKSSTVFFLFAEGRKRSSPRQSADLVGLARIPAKVPAAPGLLIGLTTI